MSNASLTASFVLKLEDKLSAGLDRLMKLLERMNKLAGMLKLPGLETAGAKLDRVTDATGRLDRALDRTGRTAGRTGRSLSEMISSVESRLGRLASRARGAFGGVFGAGRNLGHSVGIIGAAAAGLALAGPIRQYAGYDVLLRQMAITQGLRGNAVAPEMARLDAFFREDALRTGQTSLSIAEAAQDLLRSGIAMKTVLQLLPAHSMAATAYNISPEDLGQAVFALNTSFGIGEGDIKGALAALALAAKSGKFSVQDLSHFLPAIGGTMNLLGMSGRSNADMAFAALETVRMNTGDSGTAATNFGDLLRYMTSPTALRSFGGYSRMMDPITRRMYADGQLHRVDLEQVFASARAHGVNPLMAFMQVLRDQVKGQSPEQMGFTLGRLLHNQQTADAAKALIQHWDHFTALMLKLKAADADTITQDWITMFRSPAAQLRIFGELLGQITRRAGEGLVPMLQDVNGLLLRTVHALDQVDGAGHAWVSLLIQAAGWITMLLGVLGTLGFVAPVVANGFRLVWSLFKLLGSAAAALWDIGETLVISLMLLGVPFEAAVALVVGLAAAVGAMVTDIVAHWDRFRDQFGEIWSGITGLFKGGYDILMGLATFDGARILRGLQGLKDGVVSVFTGIVGVVRQLFTDLWNLLADIPGAGRLGIHHIAAARPAGSQARFGDVERLHISVGLEPGLRARLDRASPGVPHTAPPRNLFEEMSHPPTGPTTARP